MICMAQNWRDNDPTYSVEQWNAIAEQIRVAEAQAETARKAKIAADLAHATCQERLADLFRTRRDMIVTEVGRSSVDIATLLSIGARRVVQIGPGTAPQQPKTTRKATRRKAGSAS